MIAFTELAWRASFLFLEDAVEVAEIVESAIKTYLADTLGGIYQHAGNALLLIPANEASSGSRSSSI